MPIQVNSSNAIQIRSSARIGKEAPDFTAKAVVDGKIQDVSLSSFRGKNVVLFFWPLDFTFVCPTEVVAFSQAADAFRQRDTELIGVSVDSPYTHLAWQSTPRSQGGVGKCAFPMVSDQTHNISRSYGVLIEDQGVALRGLFLIDQHGVIRHTTINDLPLGRSVDEAIRLIDALRHFEEHGEACPANWQPGKDTIKTDPEGSRSFFESWSSAA